MLVALVILACGEQTIKDVPNSLPTVQIQSHGDNSEFDDGYEIQFYAQVSDQNHENEELQVSWYEGENLICDWETPDPSGVTRCNVVMTEEMERISVQVIDPDQGAGRDEIHIVVNPTDAPTAQIQSPMIDQNYYSDQLILFAAEISDTEDDPEDLSVEWSSSLDGILALNTSPDSSGQIEDYGSLTSGQHAIKLTVVDSTGKSIVESVVINVAGPNNEPECAITTPQSGTASIVGQNVSFLGTATDEDINNSYLRVTWESDIDGVFNSSPPLSDGSLAFTTNVLSAGNHSILLRVEDEVGGLCTAGVQIAVGTPPTLTLTSPTDGTVYSIGDSVPFTATVSDQEDISSDISLLWTSDIDGELSTSPSDSSGHISFNKSNLSAGLHSLSVVATDSTGLTASATRNFRINTPPSISDLSITPMSPLSNQNIQASVVTSDADNNSVTLGYAWLKDGNLTTYTGTGVTIIPMIPSSATSAGETWTLQVTPNDGYTNGTMAQQNVTIENSLPEITSVTIDTTNPYNDDVIQCSAVAEDIDETLVPELTWTVNGSTYTGSSLDISTTTAMPNDTITCTASVEDAFGEIFEMSDSVVIKNRAPTVDSITTTQSTAYTSSTVDCVATVSDSDGETVQPVYSWTLEGQPFAGDESSVTLSPEQVGVGETLVCSASVNDASNESDSDEITWVIANTNPVVDSLTLTPEEPFVDDELLCEVTVSDADNDDITAVFTWENLTTGDTYPSTTTLYLHATLDTSTISVQSEDIIECTVSITDEFGGLDGDSLSVTMLNSGPVFTTEASISPNTAVKTGMEVTCSAEASDPNDGNLPVTYNWNVGGVAVGTPNSDTYIVDADETDVGSVIECVASVEDTEGETAESKATVTVENTEPTVDSVTIDQSVAYNDTTLTCSSTVSDPDETPNTTYTWQKNGTDLVMGQSIQLADYNINPEDEMTCVALVEDGSNAQGTGDVSISITNRDPQLSNILIDNTEPTVETTINCSVDVTDEDGESLQPSYEWTIGSASVGDLPAFTVDSSIAVDTEITCTATVEDGYGGTDTRSTVATVQNTEPTIGTVLITPSEITSESLLSCAATGTDINDGELQASYVWTNTTTGNQLGEEATVKLTTDNASPNDVIACVATVTDGNEGTASSQSTINVGNISPVFDSEVSITPNTEVKTGAELLCAAVGSDADDGELEVVYSWTVEGLEVGNEEVYIVSADDTDVGTELFCTATITDNNQAILSSQTSVTIENTAPELSDVVISDLPVYNDSVLTCTETASDIDEQVLTATYLWTNETQGTELGSDSTLTLTSSSAVPNDVVKCAVVVSDESGDTDTMATQTSVDNRAPEVLRVSILPETAYTNTELVCSADVEDVDGDGVTVSYEWKLGITVLETGDTYVVSADDTDVADSIECVATVTDDDKTSSDSVSISIENTAPTVDSVTIDQSVAYNDTTLTCSYAISDPDESPNIEIVWSVAGVEVEETSTTLDLATTAALPQDEVICSIVATDNASSSDPSSASITLSNRAPSQPSVSISPTSPLVGVDDLTCTASSTDPDGTTPNYSYEWTQNGNSTSYTTNTISSADTSAGDTWVCIVTPDDGIDFGNTNSSSVTVASACALTDCDMSVDLGNGIGADFVLIDGDDLIDPLGRYTLDHAFYLMTTEVTQGMYESLMGTIWKDGQSTFYGVGSDYPVYYVSWHMAAHFANTLSASQGEQSCYSCSGSGTSVTCSEAMNPYDCSGYSLPTEHEWEIAARSGTTSEFWTGEGSSLGGTYSSNDCNTSVTIQDGASNPPLSDYAWFCGNRYDSTYYNTSKPVGLKLPNGFGLYDMHGNVFEWTSDWFGCYYHNSGTWCNSGSYRVDRGGDWYYGPNYLRSSNRDRNFPTYRSGSHGFRLRKLFTEDLDNDGINNLQDCDDTDSTLGSINNDADCDGLLTSEDCDDNDGSDIDLAGDCDQDGIASVDDCDDFDSGSTIVSEDSDCNGVPDDCFLTNCDMSVDLGNGIGADFVLIDGDDLIDPLGRYTLSKAFYMMTTEVTQGMFQQVMGYDSRTGQSTNYGDGDNFPAYYVSWHMAAHFANTLSASQGEQLCYSCSGSGTSVTCSEAMNPYDCSGYSLPTEHEWEIAARSGTTSEFWTGEGSSLGGTYSVNSCDTSVTIQDGVSNPPLSDYAWFCGNRYDSTYYNTSKPVGLKLPNGFGLYDMHGNLWEWTSDWYGCTYPNSGTWCDSGSHRVARGGIWSDYPNVLRSSARGNSSPAGRDGVIGFRLHKTVQP